MYSVNKQPATVNMAALSLAAYHGPAELSVAILPSTAYSSASWEDPMEDARREKRGKEHSS